MPGYNDTLYFLRDVEHKNWAEQSDLSAALLKYIDLLNPVVKMELDEAEVLRNLKDVDALKAARKCFSLLGKGSAKVRRKLTSEYWKAG